VKARECKGRGAFWRLAFGVRRMANGEWRMASGEWRVASGEWRREAQQSGRDELPLIRVLYSN
jgi:hypothetical protein